MADIILICERLNDFPQIRNQKKMFVLITSLRQSTGESSQGNSARKWNKRHLVWKEKVKLTPFAVDMILYKEDSKEFNKYY